MALRLSREAVLLDETPAQDEVVTLPSVARVLATVNPSAAQDEADEMVAVPDPEVGDDDAEEDLDDYGVSDFYADALDDA